MFASLRLFNAVVADSNSANYTYSDYSIISDYGVVISPSANYKKDEIIEFLKKERVSFEKMNNGFYKNWDKIFTVEINERLRDQCMHYFSTYGLEAFGINSPNFVYLPEGTFEVPEMNKLTVIKGVKKEFLIESCFKLLGGMALKQETINDILEVLEECEYNFNGFEEIKNREAAVIIASKTGTLPMNDNLFRCLFYMATGNTLVIKNQEAIRSIQKSNFVIPRLDDDRMKILASSFNRYKPLWLAFKKNLSKKNAGVVNKIASLSKEYHSPQKENVLLNLTGKKYTNDQIESASKKANVNQLIRALNAVSYYNQDNSSRLYRIRNGKSYYKNKISSVSNENSYELLIKELKSRTKDVKIYVPNYVNYALPVSEKMFTGNVPKGTCFYMNNSEKTMLFGVHWKDSKNERVDLDLSAINSTTKVGWNAHWSHDELGYSGDMTSGGSGASEWIYCKNIKEPFVLTLNQFRSPKDHPYSIIIGYCKNDAPSKNYLIDPNNVVFESHTKCFQKQQILGIAIPRNNNIEFYLLDHGGGESMVSSYGENLKTIFESCVAQFTSSVKIRDLFEISSKEEADIDLSPDKLTKDSFTNLFKE